MNAFRKLSQVLYHHKRVCFLLAVIALALLAAKPTWRAWAAPGDLDATFSGDGRKEDIPSTDPLMNGRMRTAIQADGKILVLNQHTYFNPYSSGPFALRRLNQNGSFDTGFDGDGTVTTSFGFSSWQGAEDVVVQPNGKIIVAGYAVGSFWNGQPFQLALARYNPNGSLDTTFDGDGKVLGLPHTIALNVALQANGKILVLGITWPPNQLHELFLARFNTNGSLDTTFGVEDTFLDFHGYTFFSPHEYTGNRVRYIPHAIQSDGKILVKEYENVCLRRYNSNGLLDTTFGVSGRLCKASAIGIQYKLQNDGKVLVLKGGGIWRLNADGSDDFSFGANGFASNNPFATNEAFAIQEDGGLIVSGSYSAGTYTHGVVCRYLSDGAIDTSFGFQQGCKATTFPALPNSHVSYSDVFLQADDRIVATGQHGDFIPGNFTPVMARYKNDNSDTQTTDVGLGTITAVPTFPFSQTSWTYTIPVTNYSSGKAAHVTVTANVPTGSSFHSVTPPAGWAALQAPNVGATSGNISFSTYKLAPGAMANVRFRVTIPPRTPPGTPITTIASVTNTIPDTNTSNNSANKTFIW